MTATTTQVLATGDTLTIWPRVGIGESRDTEPGAQPWKATFLGITPTGEILIDDGYGQRLVNADFLKA